jgi:SNF2 family DNA or RNA helicase
MVFLDFLEPFRRKALTLQAADIIFSGPTYQVRYDEEGESVWVFLQLDHNNQIKDIFCHCEESSETGGCVHMAAACLALFGKRARPMHQRFEDSPLFVTFEAYEEAFHHIPLTYEKRKGSLIIGKGQHSIKISGPTEWIASIEELLLHREEETEETSIKFSDLSEEELELWRIGKPPRRLRFELSKYSELSKKIFLRNETSPYRYLLPQKEGRFSSLVCQWDDGNIEIPLVGHVLGQLLDTPSLFPLDPPIERNIKKLEIDYQTLSLRVRYSGKKVSEKELITSCGNDWWFVPGRGFCKSGEFQKEEIILEQDVPSFLDQHEEVLGIIQPLVPLQYHVEIEENRGIRISAFLQTPHDIDDAVLFEHWLSRAQSTFLRIEPPFFGKLSCWVGLNELSEFFSTHRHWLKTIEGCTVHEQAAKEHVSFTVERTGALVFHIEKKTLGEKAVKSLGSWVWVENEGFFPQETNSRFPINAPIPPHRVAEFIRKHNDLLEEVPHFFAKQPLIHGIGLDIRSVRRRRVHLLPVYQWTNPSFRHSTKFYDDIGYIPDVGFFYLPTLLAQSHFTRTIEASDREEWDRFFLEQLPKLKKEFPCTVDPSLEPPLELRLLCDHLDAKEEMPHTWDAGFYWESEKGKVRTDEIALSYRRGDRFCITDAGLLDLHDQRFGWISNFQPQKKTYQLQSADFIKIRAHDAFSFDQNIVSTTAQIIEKLLQEVPAIPLDLTGFQSTLRPYQHRGTEWLWYLYCSGLSGLLCDDMGIGKTYQAMALLCSIQNEEMKAGRKGKYLVVCPTSLIWHWKEKINQVLPQFRTCVYIGVERSLDQFSPDDDILLTSYGIWRNEVASLKKIQFEAAIFDELQIAKNHVSLIWSALSQVKATMRLGLTGTPIENQLRELKAVFDLVLPGYLPQESIFREYYLRPIDREIPQERKELLARYVKPFVLRRKKIDVLPDLPSKTEELYQTELVGEQKTLYRQIASRQAVPLLDQLRDESVPVSYLHVFALLSALKQVCNHPAAYLKDIDNFEQYESGKWGTFIELLEEAQESGQKVVVFSQFLSMLDIMGKYLDTKGIGFAEIRGSTKNRGQVIQKFQTNPSCQVFLGSLQAAGLGIDLTSGSIVIHYDRWWNAARENQATDRVHRLGQNRGVMVYKLMTKHSIEERIDKMIARKAKLFEDVIGCDDHRIIRKLSREELFELLEGLDQI